MRNNFSNIALAVTLVFALAFTFGCSGDESGGGDPSSSSSGGGSPDLERIECGTSWYYAIYQDILYRCQDNVKETKCGTDWYDATNKDLRCLGEVIEFKCGASWSSDIYQDTLYRCQDDVIETRCGTGWYNALTQFCSSGGIVKDYGFFTDPRDSKTYKTVEIGEQTWFAENLNYIASDSDKCYANSRNCNKYGLLYEWMTAKTACPSGWHLPSDVEVRILMQFVDPSWSGEGRLSDNAGKFLKAISGWDSNNEGESGNGTDEFGFSALPGGQGSTTYSFFYIGITGIWWLSSTDYLFFADEFELYAGDNRATIGETGLNAGALRSVRCIQD